MTQAQQSDALKRLVLFMVCLSIAGLVVAGFGFATGVFFGHAVPPAPSNAEPGARITGTQVTGNNADITVEFSNPSERRVGMALTIDVSYKCTGKDGFTNTESATGDVPKTVVQPYDRVTTSVVIPLPLDAGCTLIVSSVQADPAGFSTWG